MPVGHPRAKCAEEHVSYIQEKTWDEDEKKLHVLSEIYFLDDSEKVGQTKFHDVSQDLWFIHTYSKLLNQGLI